MEQGDRTAATREPSGRRPSRRGLLGGDFVTEDAGDIFDGGFQIGVGEVYIIVGFDDAAALYKDAAGAVDHDFGNIVVFEEVGDGRQEWEY
jgi:hypothetical protein